MKNNIVLYSDANPPILIDALTLENCELSGMNLHRTILTGMNLKSSKLIKTDLRSAELQYSDFSNSDISRSRLTNAICVGTIFRNSDLHNCLANSANFANADFTNANLDNAILAGSSLQGAILQTTSLNNVNLDKANFDEKTVWPIGFNPLKYGAIKEALKRPIQYTKEEMIALANVHIQELNVYYKELKEKLMKYAMKIYENNISSIEREDLIKEFKNIALYPKAGELFSDRGNDAIEEIIELALGYERN